MLGDGALDPEVLQARRPLPFDFRKRNETSHRRDAVAAADRFPLARRKRQRLDDNWTSSSILPSDLIAGKLEYRMSWRKTLEHFYCRRRGDKG